MNGIDASDTSQDVDIRSRLALNFTSPDGKVIILYRSDIFPSEYLPYLLEHEKWEAYVARKGGWNAWSASKKTFIESNEGKYDRILHLNALSEYRFEIRHEIAVWKEYFLSHQQDALSEYHKWCINQNTADFETATQDSVKNAIHHDTAIRNRIYLKITNVEKYHWEHDIAQTPH